MDFVREEDIFEDDLDILEIIDHGIPRLVYTRADHFHQYNEHTFFKRFRLTKDTALHLLMRIEEHLEFPSDM